MCRCALLLIERSLGREKIDETYDREDSDAELTAPAPDGGVDREEIAAVPVRDEE